MTSTDVNAWSGNVTLTNFDALYVTPNGIISARSPSAVALGGKVQLFNNGSISAVLGTPFWAYLPRPMLS